MNTAAIVQALNAVQALINFIVGRGISRDRIQAILDEAHENGADVSTDVVQNELNQLSDELDETDELLNG